MYPGAFSRDEKIDLQTNADWNGIPKGKNMSNYTQIWQKDILP